MKKAVLLSVFVFLAFNYLKNVKAQDTFGPICDDVTVTCVPTETPTEGPSPTPASEAPTPTESLTPTPDTPTPTELPRAGTTDNFNRMLMIAIMLITVGAISHLALSTKNS